MPDAPVASARRWRRTAAAGLAAATLFTAAAVAGGADPAPVAAACAINTRVGLGSRGPAVTCVQQALADRGLRPGPIDGVFGAVTYRAVVAFQRAQGLYVDGVVGRQTATALGVWGAPASPPAPTPPAAPANPSPPSGAGCPVTTTLRIGAAGPAVRCLQAALAAAGYAPGPVDGAFGGQTYRAVVRFQQARGLFVDGVAGRQTATALGIWGSAPSAGPPAPGPSACPVPAGVPAAARQVVVITASGSRADVDLLVRVGESWTCPRSNMNGRVGRNGVRALAARRSGDGTTPGGVFALGSMTAPDGQTFQFFGNGVNPGVHGTWRQVRAGDCWGATPNTADYNRLVTRSAAACTTPDEYLPNFQGAYSRAAIIAANMGPERSGDAPGEPALAAAIFLHRHSYDGAGNSRPTSGCVSLNNTDLIAVLQALVPGQAYFVIR